MSRDQSLDEVILESDGNESDLLAEEQEHKKQLESPNCECSTNSEEEIIDTGSGISHEEYREEVKCHPLLETIIEESDEEEHNSPVLAKSSISKDSRTKSVESLDTGLYKSPRFHSRTGNFSAKEPQESPVSKAKNDSVTKARERLNMQLGAGNGLEKKPMIVLPTREPTIEQPVKKKKKSVKKVKPIEKPEVTQNIQIIEVEETTTTIRRKKKKNSVKKEKKTKSLTVDAEENIKIIPAEPVTLREVEEILKTNKKDKKKLDREEKKKKKLEELIGVAAANQVLEDEQKPHANTLPR